MQINIRFGVMKKHILYAQNVEKSYTNKYVMSIGDAHYSVDAEIAFLIQINLYLMY